MREKVLVLNQDYQAIGVCSPQRAFVLLWLRKAELLHDYSGQALRSVSRQFKYPSVIRLFEYVRIPFRQVSLSRNNVLRRDGNRCVYCGSNQNLTLDHVVPRSQGGKDTWGNLVAACQECNTLKGNRTPEEAGMLMRHQPFKPSFILFIRDYTGRVNEQWLPYLMLGS
jgi:5-methylcytosine-specific restriction endonuclease McrA